MRITERFRRLTIWNKIFVIAAIISILSASFSLLKSVRRSGETEPVVSEVTLQETTQSLNGSTNIAVGNIANVEGGVVITAGSLKQKASSLKLHVHRSKYTHFVVVEPKEDHSKYMPPCSYLLTHRNGGRATATY